MIGVLPDLEVSQCGESLNLRVQLSKLLLLSGLVQLEGDLHLVAFDLDESPPAHHIYNSILIVLELVLVRPQLAWKFDNFGVKASIQGYSEHDRDRLLLIGLVQLLEQQLECWDETYD